MRQLQSALAEYSGEYVRLIGVDTNAKRRIAEIIVQRPGDSSGSSSGKGFATNYSSRSSNENGNGNGSLSSELAQQVRSLLAAGYKIGTEHADKRRFRTKSWQSCSPINSNREAEVIAALEACLAEHSGEYVRMIGIDSNAKRRVSETIIQRPGSAAVTQTASTVSSNGNGYSSNGNGYSSNGYSSNNLSAETLQQVKSLLSSGYKIGTEHANKRRFKNQILAKLFSN